VAGTQFLRHGNKRNDMNDTRAVPEWVRARYKVNIEAVMSLGADVVREEMDLYTTKWFDYRFIFTNGSD
jgi:hypothetical protein